MLNIFIDFLFFSRCSLCGDFENDNGICFKCFSNLEFINMACIKCQNPLLIFSNNINVCDKCLEGYDFYNQMICPLVYSKFLKHYILNFKNNNVIYLSNLFAKLIYNKSKSFISSRSIIAPVPLFKDKLYKRGYNQSLVLAKAFANIANIPCYPDLILRVRDTKTQANKTAQERSINVKNAFELNVNYDISGKEIFIIDDIITTGSTIFECASVFKNTYVRDVFLLAIAKRVKL